jgi:hypothetical protein
MNQDLGLKILGRIMNWSDDRAREEFRWLRLMARLKYDGYRLPGEHALHREPRHLAAAIHVEGARDGL